MFYKMSPVRKICFTAIFTALGVIFTCLAKAIPMNVFPFLRFSPTPALVVFSSLFLGPLSGGFIGVFTDLVPAFIFPSGGDYNFYLSFIYFLLGFFPYFLYQGMKRFSFFKNQIWGFLFILIVLFAVQIGVFYGTNALSPLGDMMSILAPIGLVITFIFDCGAFLFVYKKAQVKNEIHKNDNPILVIAWVSIISQVVLMDIGKSLAFFAYYSTIGNNGNPVLFSTYYLMQLIGSPINFLLMMFLTILFINVVDNMFFKKEI